MYQEQYVVEGYTPSENEEYMNPRQLHYFKNLLLQRRRELIEEVQVFKTDLKNNLFKAPDPVDLGAAHADILLDFQSHERNGGAIEKIDRALGKIADGEYGYCELTGEDIGLKRLTAKPTATLSIEAQEMIEREQRKGQFSFATSSQLPC